MKDLTFQTLQRSSFCIILGKCCVFLNDHQVIGDNSWVSRFSHCSQWLDHRQNLGWMLRFVHKIWQKRNFIGVYIYIYCDIGLYSFSLLTPDFFICWYPVHYWLHFWPVESRFCSSKHHALLVGSPSFCCPILPELPCRLQHDEVLLLNFLRSISHSYWPHHHLCSLITSLFMLKCWLCARPNSKLGCQNWNNVWLYPNLQFFFLSSGLRSRFFCIGQEDLDQLREDVSKRLD